MGILPIRRSVSLAAHATKRFPLKSHSLLLETLVDPEETFISQITRYTHLDLL